MTLKPSFQPPGHFRKALILLALATLGPAISQAANPVDLFEDGNRLFRDDLYWAALLRYDQAEDAGLNSPELYYNMGVAHYRAGQYTRARNAFTKASKAPGLRVVSEYNLGLTAWKAGDTDEALRWFRKSREQQENRHIRSLSKKAISRIEDETMVEMPVMVKAEAVKKRKEIARFDLTARIGGGMDSNVFRSPSNPYIDLSDSTQPLITPVVQQGFYIPANVWAKYSVQSFENESFFGAYRLGGRYYQDKALTNGNEYLHELRFGTEYEKRVDDRKRQIYSAFTIAEHNEVYYDRDTGGDYLVNDVDITDRFNYFRYGPEAWFRQSYKRLAIGIRGLAQIWNYEYTEEVPEYDHEYFRVGVNAQYRFTQTSLLRVTGDAYKRHFGDRPSFELDGSQPLGTPPVEYDYLEVGISARQRITRGMWFSIDYLRTQREDGYVGYNNYVKNSYGAQIHLDVGERFSFEASGAYQIYDYENAFAFQNPAAGRKILDRIFGSVIVTFEMTPNLMLVTGYNYHDAQSNDARIAYNRSQISVGVRWENR